MDFNKENHLYEQDGVSYQSVSEWCEQFIKPFPAETIATAISKKKCIDKQDILDKWSMKADFAVDYGNSVHKAIEYYIKYGEIPDHSHLEKVVKEFIKLNTYKKLISEVIVYDEKTKIAGTIDILVALGNKEVIIRDIKTNGDLHKEAKGKLLPPYDSLEANSINKYTLQISMYKKLAEARGLKVVGTEIWYWGGSKFDIINIKTIEV